MDIGAARVLVAQLPAHRIMPVRTGAVPPPEPDAQPKPGKGGKQQGDQVPFTGAGKYPSRDIEEDESGMKNKEKYVQESVPHDRQVLLYAKYLFNLLQYPIFCALNLF